MDRIRQILTLAGLTALEVIRQPATLLITLSSVLFAALLPLLITHTLGEPGKLVRDSALSIQFSVGLVLCTYCACATFSGELRSGTAGSILSKPISREAFFLAKYLGVVIVLLLYQGIAGITTLMTSRSGAQSFFIDWYAATPLILAIILSLLAGGIMNYVRQKPFSSSAFVTLFCFLLTAFIIGGFLAPDGSLSSFGGHYQWNILPAVLLITVATLMLSAISVALATRLDIIPAFTVCSTVFFVGLVSDYLVGRHAAASLGMKALYAIIPNWQHFWMADALSNQEAIPWSYVGQTTLYAVLYSAAVLVLGIASFRSMDVSR
jgi:ABC-type transport system involved in multi-copper enzyme maturation permease subunit